MSVFNVLYASDDNYAPIAGVSITSLFENNQDAEQIYVWYLVDDVSQDNMEKLLKTAEKYNRIITFIDANDSLAVVKKLGANSWFGESFSAYSRLFLQEYVRDKGVERLLYLDCDTIINKNINELWNCNLEGKTIGMVCDYVGAGIRDVIGLKRTDKYYNSGVLLIDMNLWKANKCQERILWHMQHVNAKYPFIDQDIINVVMRDEIKTLPWNWNVFPYYYTYSFKNLQKQYDLNEVNQYSVEEYGGCDNDGKPNALILHYTATFYGKPWYANNCDPNGEIWHRYYKISEWHDSYKLTKKKWNSIERFSRIIVKMMPQRIYLLIFCYFSRRYMNTLRKEICNGNIS